MIKDDKMIRVDRKELARCEILRCATNFFMKEGYSNTTFRMMGKAINMSTGNMTYYFKTKEHLLAQMVDMLGKFQRKRMDNDVKDGNTPIMAVCRKLFAIISACEQDEVIRDFVISAYTSPICLEIIRKNEIEQAKEVFREYCLDWTDEQFANAGCLVSGIEYSTLQRTNASASLEARVSGAIELILTIYNVPQKLRKEEIKKTLSLDYKSLGLSTQKDFKAYVDKETKQRITDLLK